MNQYEKPFMEVVAFEDDVITGSPGNEGELDPATDKKLSLAADLGEKSIVPDVMEESPLVGDSKTIVSDNVGD